jgi:L-xylulokinase
MQYFMGIDNGGTVCKVAIYNKTGQEIAISSRKIEMLYPAPGFTEKNMDEFWNANIEAISEVIKESGIDPADIAGIAPTGHGNGMFLIDDQGESIGNGIISTDSRAKSYVDQWYKDGTFEIINKKTMQSIWPGQPAALLRWFKDHQSETLDKTRWILMCKDYIRFKLTGEVFAEITDYSGTNLVNIRTSEYDAELLKSFGIEEYINKLPDLKLSADICGKITEEVASITGLRVGTPVMGGFFDIHACAIATGTTEEEQLNIIAGTWSINQFISKTPVGSEELFMTSIYGIPGYWLVTDASPTSASNLEWFIKNILGDIGYDEIDSLVNGLAPEESDVLFFPFLFGNIAGVDLSSSFIGLKGWHSKQHMLRAVFEGIVFGHKLHVDRLLKHRNTPEVIRISGGASKSEVWVQMFADILNLPIEITDNDELGTLGAAMAAAVGAGTFKDFREASQSMVRVTKIVNPQAERVPVYQEKFRKFSRTLDALKSIAE